MCGRFSLTVTAETLIKKFALTQSIVMVPRYNIAPSGVIPIIRKMGSLEFVHWGLKPKWMTTLPVKEGFMNARMETANTKPAFKSAFRKRRCLIVADGYYEWKPVGRVKQPYYICQKNREVFVMAGLWEEETCALLTTPAEGFLASIHERMPVILGEEDYALWLNPKTDAEEMAQRLSSKVYNDMVFHPVSTRMNRVGFEGVECVQSL